MEFYKPVKRYSKRVLTKGGGFYVPIDGAVCKLLIIRDDKCIVSDVDTVHRIKEITIGESDGEIDEILESCLGTMKEDEVAQVDLYLNLVASHNADKTLVEKETKTSKAKYLEDIEELKSPVVDEDVVREDITLLKDLEEREKNDRDEMMDNKETDNIMEMEAHNNEAAEDESSEHHPPSEEEENMSNPEPPPAIEMDTERIEIQLLSFSRQPEIWEMSVTEKWRRATHHKERGVELFSKGDYKWAFRRFSASLKYLISVEHDIPPERLEEEIDVKGLKLSCYLNLAACHLKRPNYESAVKVCSKAIELDAYNAKALYRRGSAYVQLQEYDKAKIDLNSAAELEPKNVAIAKQQQLLKARLHKLNKFYAKAMKKMFA